MGQREDFERALVSDPDDWRTRLVYADWLEIEGDRAGDDDLALEQRRMATREWVESRRWIADEMEKLGWGYDEVMSVTEDYLSSDGMDVVSSHLDRDRRSWVDKNREACIRHWEVVTGRKFEHPDGDWSGLGPFGCC